MRYITNEQIEALGISAATCVEWVREAFLLKDRCQLPPKVSVHPRGDDFINTMPCLLPEECHAFGCKVVSRTRGQQPALNSQMMVFDTLTGRMSALFDADWITTMRTAAVANLAIDTLARPGASVFAFIGLGAVGHAVVRFVLETHPGRQMTLRLMRYKDHAEKVVEQFAPDYPDVKFEIADSAEALVDGADVVVSCITSAEGLIVDDASLFRPGVLVVPVHTRGFQNCDTVFDSVFADDEGHVKGFRYFNEFRRFAELADVLAGRDAGRRSESERILAYNIGLGLHDIYFAYNILKLL